MVVGILEIHLRLDGCFSLKDKRRTLRSLMDRSRRDFRVSIAETADHDLWNVATLGASCVSNDPVHAQSVLTSVVNLVEANPEVQIEASSTWIERFEA